jgi:hypothetical protein
MPDHTYSEEVSRLLNIGDPREAAGSTNFLGEPGWLNYLEQFGLNTGQVPELVRMARDEDLNQAMSDTTEVWAPIHAWRALGQLKAVEAVEPLVGLLHRIDDEDDDWAGEDIPKVLGMIGPAAIQPVAVYLADPKNPLWARVAAAASLEKIGNAHPQSRMECINALTAVLEKYADNDEILNGELVTALADLDAVEAAPIVEQAFKADRVDESIMGDWEDFQVEVGLLEERVTDPFEDLNFNPFIPRDVNDFQRPLKKEDKQVKKKRKQAKESRKKNRQKKKK